tara:strand:- start:5104 stop:5883 length:780 start_codon:yes stop_codon:yes gene_type:complete
MHIDFTEHIKKMKERDVLHKPFPVADGFAVFDKDKNENWVKVLFSSRDQLQTYLSKLGYEWGNENKHEYTNFDCELRLLKVLPELSDVETVAADPQWEISEKEVELPQNSSTRTMEDVPDAVELREVDHPIGYDERTHASEDSESKDYSKLWDKVNAFRPRGLYGFDKFRVGDAVKNVNPNCKHFNSEGIVENVRELKGLRMRPMMGSESDALEEVEDTLGCVFAYVTTNDGPNWSKGEVLEKTPDQLELVEAINIRPF